MSAPETAVASVESTSNASLVGAMPTALTRGRGLWRRRTGALRVGGRSADIGPERLSAPSAELGTVGGGKMASGGAKTGIRGT